MRRRLFGGLDPREVLAPLVARVDLLFLSEDESELLVGGSDPKTIGREGLNARTVVVHGSGGAFALEGDDVTAKEAYPAEPVDFVGAGDAFVAGFLSGQLRGWSTEGCLQLANVCGACAVTVPGDAESMPSEEEALALVRGSSKKER